MDEAERRDIRRSGEMWVMNRLVQLAGYTGVSVSVCGCTISARATVCVRVVYLRSQLLSLCLTSSGSAGEYSSGHTNSHMAPPLVPLTRPFPPLSPTRERVLSREREREQGHRHLHVGAPPPPATPPRSSPTCETPSRLAPTRVHVMERKDPRR